MKYAITVSPDPKCIVGRKPIRYYRNCEPYRQYCILNWEISQIVKHSMEAFEGKYIHLVMYFEFNKSGQMHCHGILDVEVEEQMLYIQQRIYDELGKMSFKDDTVLKKICCNVQLLVDVDNYRQSVGTMDWQRYIIKDQTALFAMKYPMMNIGNMDIFGKKNL